MANQSNILPISKLKNSKGAVPKKVVRLFKNWARKNYNDGKFKDTLGKEDKEVNRRRMEFLEIYEAVGHTLADFDSNKFQKFSKLEYLIKIYYEEKISYKKI